MERINVKQAIVKLLTKWNYNKSRAGPREITRELRSKFGIETSYNYVQQVLLNLELSGIVKKSKVGREVSYYLV